MTTDATYMAEQINKKLAGKTIVGAVVDAGGESFGLMIRGDDGQDYPVWVDCDAEGNGPGWLQISGAV